MAEPLTEELEASPWHLYAFQSREDKAPRHHLRNREQCLLDVISAAILALVFLASEKCVSVLYKVACL